MPIDPRIPLMGSGGDRSVGVQFNPMQSLAQIYQILNMVEDNKRAELLMRMQEGESAQRMQLAREQAERAQTTFGQQNLTFQQAQQEQARKLREQGFTDVARTLVGGAPNLDAMTDEEWEQMLDQAVPEVRIRANELRTDFRAKAADARKKDADATDAASKAKAAQAESLASLVRGARPLIGNSVQGLQGLTRVIAQEYPALVKQYEPLIRQVQSEAQVAQLYDAMEKAGVKPPAAPPTLGAFQLSGGPGTVTEQYDEAGKLVRRLAVPQTASQAGTAGTAESDTVDAIVEGIIDGTQPPTLTGLYRYAAGVRAGLAKKDYNLADAQLDWQAAQRHFATMNNPQQTRLRQAVDNSAHALDVIDDLAAKWKGSRFPTLNRANLALAKGGAYPAEVQSIATQLEAQIADLTSELANVYMGGNSPTEQSLKLAAHNLSADWSEKVLKDMVNLARRNLQIRRNAIATTGVISPGTNTYVPAPPTEPTNPKDPLGILR